MNTPICRKLKTAAIIGSFGLAAAAVPVYLLAPGVATKRQKAPFYGRNYAHRGLHSEDRTVPENSLEAFRLAGQAGYGAELDVQLTKDGQVIVFHDDTLDRACDVHAYVADKTYEELRQLSLFGTQERIPLLQEVLDIYNGSGPLIVELKSGSRNRELCEKTYDILSDYPGAVCVESFDPRIMLWFRRHGKDMLRGQLATRTKDYDSRYSRSKVFFLSHCLLNFLSRPHFIAYRIGHRPLSVRICESMGAMCFGWTARNDRAERGRDGVIFEFFRPLRRFK